MAEDQEVDAELRHERGDDGHGLADNDMLRDRETMPFEFPGGLREVGMDTRAVFAQRDQPGQSRALAKTFWRPCSR